MDSRIAIEVKGVSKIYKLYERNRDRIMDAFGFSKKPRYKEHYALRDIRFAINKGETVGIIGTNGAGKSTILKIITGVIQPTEGTLAVNGRISALLELGAGFNMEYTGMENIYLSGTMMGYSKAEIDAKVDEILKFADIGEFVHQPCKTYSSGMFVRLAFAVAINIDPEILIVDEALSVGDVFFQAKCFKKFEDYKKMGKTILMVSHDLSSIVKYCDRVILFDHGTLIKEGNPKEIVDMYKKLLVNQLDLSEAGNKKPKPSPDSGEASLSRRGVSWKSHFQINPELNEYGTKIAKIVDFSVEDEEGQITNCIQKGTWFTIKSRVQFQEEVQDPIFTYTFKNTHGVPITGTNSMYEKKDIGVAKQGSEYIAAFTQMMNLQGGEYLLSISCTGYADGEFTVYHRLYDVISITVVSDKNTVGYYDMFSDVEIEKVR